MLKIDEQGNIEITKGDNFSISLIAYKDESHSEKYILKEGEFFVLSVRVIAGSEPVIRKETRMQDSEGGFSFEFTPQETSAMSRSEYVYDVALANEEGNLKNTFLGGEELKRVLKVV